MKGFSQKIFGRFFKPEPPVQPEVIAQVKSDIEKALEASEDRFERFFEEAPLGIVQINEDYEITDSNYAFNDMFGATKGILDGTPFKNLVHKADQNNVINMLHDIRNKKKVQLPLEVRLLKDKTEITTRLYARRLRDQKNIVLHLIDVTEQKVLEEQFVQSQKMQAVGQLAGGIAHDFNNLLTAMIGFCDLLLLRHKPGDPSFSDIMQIKQNSNRAANLVRQLLAFSRQQTLRQKVQDVTDILTELSHLLRRLIGASIELDILHGNDLGLIKVDEGQMDQVLINLAVNARDAMNGKGQMRIETSNFYNDKPMELISEEMPAGSWTKITVSDTGSGIDKKTLGRIFEPFFTTKKAGQGTGLGLATVYGIVRQSDGFLDVETKVGEGTSFHLYFPHAAPEETKEEKIEESSIVKDLTGSERILLVEDEEAVRRFSQRALSNKGYQVVVAESGEDALAVLEKEGLATIDLIITDVVMPGMDGPTLVEKIREQNKDLKVIFMSGYTEDKLKDHMGENTYFLPKPFTLKVLASKVRDVLEE